PPVQAIYKWQAPLDGRDTPFDLTIRDQEGQPTYKLECHNGNYETQTTMNFSGDFQCGLFALKNGKRASWNLLAGTSPAAQHSYCLNRARMTASELRGTWGARPEYGRLRHFELRDM